MSKSLANIKTKKSLGGVLGDASSSEVVLGDLPTESEVLPEEIPDGPAPVPDGIPAAPVETTPIVPVPSETIPTVSEETPVVPYENPEIISEQPEPERTKSGQLEKDLTDGDIMSGGSLSKKDDYAGEIEEIKITTSVISVLDLDADADDEMFNDEDMEEYEPSLIFKERGFQKLLTLFDTVICELDDARKVGVPMEEVKELFFTVWASVEKCHQNELTLVRNDRDLSTTLVDTMAKTKILIKLAHNDIELAKRLGRRLEAAWSLVDIGEVEERKNTQKIEILKEEIFTLNRSISVAANLEGLDQVNDLVKLRKKLAEERDILFKEASKLRATVTLLKEKRGQQGERKLQFQDLFKFSLDEVAAQKEAIARETARKETILLGIEETGRLLELKEDELLHLGSKVLHGQQKIEELERNVRDQKFANEAALREAELSSNRIDKLRVDFELQTQLVERMTLEALIRSQEFKSLEDEIATIKLETHRMSRQKTSNNKKSQALEEHLTNLEAERESLKAKISVLERELEAAQKKLEENRRHVEELDKERTFVNRNLQRAVAVAEENDSQAKIHTTAVANLQSEMQAFEREIKNQTKAIEKIESERDWYHQEATKLTSYAALGMEEVKKVSANVFEVRKRVGEIQEEFKKAQQLYDIAMNEKMSSEKMLRELEISILSTDLKVKYKVFEINAFNYQLCDKEKIYVVEMDKRERILSQTKFYSEGKKRMKVMELDMKRQVEALEMERSTLSKVIAETEGVIAKQKYYRNAAESQKDNYQRKLMAREHELKEVAEKLRTLHSQVRIGNYHYRRIVKEIGQMRQNLVNIRKIQFYFKNNVNHVNELRQEIAVLDNCISKEICMVNDLNNQLTRPKNIHRWRSLEALDPEAYDMVRKINLVINRLVERNGGILKQSQVIKGKEEILVEIRKLLRRSPGLETPEERLYFGHLVLAKERQFDILKRELNTAEGQTTYYRNQVIKLNEVYKEIREQFFAAKRQEIKTGIKWSEFIAKSDSFVAKEESDEEEKAFQYEAEEYYDNVEEEEEYIEMMQGGSLTAIEFQGEGEEAESEAIESFVPGPVPVFGDE